MNCALHALDEVLHPLFSNGHSSDGGGRRVCHLFRVFSGLALLLAFIAPANLLRAQTIYGSIRGVVTDSSGAVVPGVMVTVRESSTSTENKTVTNKSGSYSVSFLKPGNYTVRFEKIGFAQYDTNELNLVLNQDLVVDGKLRVGANSQVITVEDRKSVV